MSPVRGVRGRPYTGNLQNENHTARSRSPAVFVARNRVVRGEVTRQPCVASHRESYEISEPPRRIGWGTTDEPTHTKPPVLFWTRASCGGPISDVPDDPAAWLDRRPGAEGGPAPDRGGVPPRRQAREVGEANPGGIEARGRRDGQIDHLVRVPQRRLRHPLTQDANPVRFVGTHGRRRVSRARSQHEEHDSQLCAGEKERPEQAFRYGAFHCWHSTIGQERGRRTRGRAWSGVDREWCL